MYFFPLTIVCHVGDYTLMMMMVVDLGGRPELPYHNNDALEKCEAIKKGVMQSPVSGCLLRE